MLVLMAYGIYVNRASTIHADKIIALQRINIVGAKAEYRDIYPTLFLKQFQLKHHWTTDIAARYEGVLEKVYVEEGDFVRTGQPLALAVNEELNFQILQAVSNIRETEASLVRFKQDFARYEPLAAIGAVSLQQLDGVAADINATRARIESQTAAHDQLLTRKKQGTLTAPRAGRIIKIYQQEGSFVPTGSPIMLLIGENELFLEKEFFDEDITAAFFQSPHFELTSISLGHTSGASTDMILNRSGSDILRRGNYSLILEKIEPPPDVAASTRTITWRLLDKGVNIPPGVYYFGLIAASVSQKMLVIPLPAVFSNEYVYVVDRDNRLEKRKITVGLGDHEYIQVLEGLEENEVVVVSGKTELFPGASVKISL